MSSDGLPPAAVFAEEIGDQRRDAVGEKRLLEQPGKEQGQPDAHILLVEAARRGVELRHHLAVMHDRAGDELRKEQDEQTVVLERERLDAPGLYVDQEGDLLKGDEGHAERQDDVRQHEIRAEHVIDRVDQKVGVFEIAEESDIEANSGEEHSPGKTAPSLIGAKPLQQPRQREVDRNRWRDQNDVERSPPRIEDE